MSNRVGTYARRWLRPAALLCPWLLGAGCSGLWDGFLAQRSCDAQTGCPPGQACNLSSQRCEPVGTDGGTPQAEVAGVCVLPTLCWENPRPQGNDLTAVSARAATDVWAVGMTRTVLHYDGTTWQQAIEPSLLDRDHLFGVHALSAQDIWLVGQGGMIRRSGIATISRTSWVSQTPPGGNDLLAVHAAASGAAFAVGGQHDWFACINCVAWGALNLQTPGNLLGVFAASASSIWAVGDQGIILHSSGTGQPTQDNSGTVEQLNTVWGTSSTDLMAVGANGTTLRRGTGSTWTTVNAGSTDELRGLWGAENQRWTTAMRSDGRGQVLQLQSDQWKAVSEPGAPLTALSGYETTALPGIWAVGANGTLLKGNGTTWTLKSQGPTEDLYAIWGVHDSNVWAGGKRGTLLHYDGRAWSAVTSPTTGDIVSIHGTAEDDIWLSTTSGGLFHFDGSAWTGSATYGDMIPAVWAASRSEAWAAAEMGPMHTILHNKGQGWQIADMPTQPIHAFWGSTTTDIWAFGSAGAVRRWNGTNWTVGSTPTTSTDFLAATGVAANRMWMATAAGTIYEWNGTVWRPMATMGTPTLLGIAAVSDSRIMAVGNTSNAKLGFIAQYNGASWEALPTVVQRSLYAAWANPKGTIWIAGQGGTILRSSL